jgi:hypothetical protein
VRNTRTLIQQNLGLGGSISIAASFPQIGISMSVHPQSACHMVEAWAGAGSENNPRGRFEPHRPHLLTVNRGVDSNGLTPNQRGRRSTRKFICTNSNVDDKDEYPPKVFEENAGTSSVKCVLLNDNRGAGSEIGNQIDGDNFYGSNPNPYGRLDNGSVVEMVVRQ